MIGRHVLLRTIFGVTEARPNGERMSKIADRGRRHCRTLEDIARSG